MTKEIDLGFGVDEVAAGIEAIVGGPGAEADAAGGHRFEAADGVTVRIGPLPEDRRGTTLFFPRTLAVLDGPADAVERLYRRIVLRFLRVGG